MNTFTDYYALLGVDADASPETIKTAFKKLALQYHPDVYKGADANERMSALLQAYQTLSDADERKSYDKHRAERGLDGQRLRATPQNSYGSPKSSAPAPAARRDRNRYYAFPDIRDGASVIIDLHDMHYHLSASEAMQLRQQGILRGNAPKADDGSYYCHRCHHHWSRVADERGEQLPRACPKCSASDWREYLLLRCIHCCAVFESEQIRYEVGAYKYGSGTLGELCPPYELFPLCPYCATAHWCPTEDARVTVLRQQAAHRVATVQMFWMSMLVVVVVILGVVIFMLH